MSSISGTSSEIAPFGGGQEYAIYCPSGASECASSCSEPMTRLNTPSIGPVVYGSETATHMLETVRAAPAPLRRPSYHAPFAPPPLPPPPPPPSPQAMAEIDRRFGEGFARDNPSLLEAFLNVATTPSDGVASCHGSGRFGSDDGNMKPCDVTPPAFSCSSGLPPPHMLPRQALCGIMANREPSSVINRCSEVLPFKCELKRSTVKPKARRRVGWR